MEVRMPVEVLERDCKRCDDLDIEVVGPIELWYRAECIGKEFCLRCSHLDLCKRLKRRFDNGNHE